MYVLGVYELENIKATEIISSLPGITKVKNEIQQYENRRLRVKHEIMNMQKT